MSALAPGPLLDEPLTTEAFERIEPARRDIPLRRPPNKPPRVAAALALVGAIIASLVALIGDAPLDLTWEVTAGRLTSPDDLLVDGSDVPFEVELTAGDEPVTVESDLGRLSFSPGSIINLTAPMPANAGSLALVEGQVLIETERASYTVRATIADISGIGRWRVERDETPRLAVYEGTAAVIGDQNLIASRLAEVALDGTVARARPITLDPDDAWDAAQAPGPIATDVQVEQLRQGLESQYGVSPQVPAFYGDFVAVTGPLEAALRELSPSLRGERFGPPADTLVSAAVIETIRVETEFPIDQVLGQVLPLRADGGTWGVILARFDLGADALRRVADTALRQREAQGEDAVPVIDPPGAVTPPSQPDPVEPDPVEPDPVEPDPTEPPDTPDPVEPTDPPTEPPPTNPLEDPIGTLEDLITPGEDPLGIFELLDEVLPVGGLVGAARGLLGVARGA